VKGIRLNHLHVAAGFALFCSLPAACVTFAQQATSSTTTTRSQTSGQASVQSGGDHPTTPAQPQQATAPPTQASVLSQLSWLEGRWRGEWGSRIAEQTWLAAKGGEVAGMFRLVEGEKTLVLELFSLVEKPEGVQFYLRHFTPELLPWEKSDATMLKLETIDAMGAVFVNPLNGEPKRSILKRVDADTYTARSEIEPEQGEPQAIEITFRRQKPPAAAASGGSAAHRKKP
jgi:hypothetical protein